MWISQLWRYPVKSMAGERLERTWLGPDGIPGDRVLYVVDGRGEILSARTKPRLLAHRATFGDDGEVLVDGLPWTSPEVAAAVRDAAGPDARLVRATGPERFDILPLLVATDGAIAAFGHDARRLRPNIVIGGVDGLDGARLGRHRARGRRRRRSRWRISADAAWSPPGIPTRSSRMSTSCAASAPSSSGSLALNAWTARDGRVAVGDDVRALHEPIDLPVPATGRFVVAGPPSRFPAGSRNPVYTPLR